ncbi:hypothetical protein, partial [Thiolapillus sp.]
DGLTLFRSAWDWRGHPRVPVYSPVTWPRRPKAVAEPGQPGFHKPPLQPGGFSGGWLTFSAHPISMIFSAHPISMMAAERAASSN